MAAKGKNSQAPTIVIKKVVKGGGDGHHGGAWKVAYADFVTAMMAFFLLLWLLNVTTDEQKSGIADYFTPAAASRSTSGSGAILGGLTLTVDGARMSDKSNPTIVVDASPPPRVRMSGQPVEEHEEAAEAGKAGGRDDDIARADVPPDQDRKYLAFNSEKQDLQNRRHARDGEFDRGDKTGQGERDAAKLGEGEKAGETDRDGKAEAASISDEQARTRMAEIEQRNFAITEQRLKRTIASVKGLQDLKDNILIERTPEGLRIQLVDKDGRSMFPSGSSLMPEPTRSLLQQIGTVVAQLPNRVAITGHTDSVPFRGANGYGNWELSADRANASRRAMAEGGLPMVQIDRVVGKADTDPLDPDNPRRDTNRRISILLLTDLPPASGRG